MSTKVFIDGEAGTTGLQIRERLAARDDIALITLDEADRKDAGARTEALAACDVAILCLPDAAAKEAITLIPDETTRVIDASTAHRVADGWVYGFPELAPEQPEAIANARFVANPGCYPQGLIAAVRPLVDAGLVPRETGLTYNAISGYTGGGKAMIADYRGNDGAPPFLPYGLTLMHKHAPEMLIHSRLDHRPIFQPSVGNYAQGMVGAVPLPLWALPGRPSGADIHAALAARYAGSRFVEVMPPAEFERSHEVTPEVLNGTNTMRLYVFANNAEGEALVLSVYDNLGKGASGAAVQNLNLMIGVPEDKGLSLAEAA